MPSRFASLTSLFYFFYFWATGVFIIFVPKTLANIGYTPAQIGILLSIMPLIRFAMPFLFSLGLRFTKKTFLYSLAFSTVSFLAFVFTFHSFWLIFINTVLYGIFISVTLPYIDTAALSVIPKERYGLVRLFGSIGFMIAGLILGEAALSNTLVFWHYFVSVALMSVCGALLVFDKAYKEEQEDNQTQSSELKIYLNDIPFWVAMILVQLSFGAFYGFFTIFESSHGMSMQNITYLWSVGVLAEIIMFAFQGRLLKNIRPLFIIKLSILTLIARWLLLHFFAGNFLAAFIAQTTHAISFALFTTAAFLFIYSRYEDKKKAQMYFYGFSYGLGGFFGGIISGALYGANIFLYSAIFAVAALISLSFFKKPI
jgi:MFS transporter, PPP family, 3-phenylpropionic acid transporter